MMPARSDPLTLYEHETKSEVALSDTQARALSALRFKAPEGEDGAEAEGGRSAVVDVSPGRKSDFYNLRARNIVGSITVAGLNVRILPKVGPVMAIQMLAYNAGLARLLEDPGIFGQGQSFAEVLVAIFLDSTDSILRNGIAEDYVSMSETLQTVRGRLDFSSLIRRALPAPVDCVYDEFLVDTPVNRLLVQGLNVADDLHTMGRQHRARVRLLLAAFAEVSPDGSWLRYRGESLPPRISYYKEALTLATMLIEGAGVELAGASRRAIGLLFDMNRVVEGFISALIRRTTAPRLSVDTQGRSHPLYLDRRHLYRLKPDFAVWDSVGCRLVGDIKYKVLDKNTAPPRADLYQIVSYAAAARADRALLVYVGKSLGQNVNVALPGRGADIKIEVRSIVLDGEIREMEDRIREVVAFR